MNAFTLTLAAVALTFGAGAAQAELKVPGQYPLSSERTSVDQVGAGRLVDSRSRTETSRTATKRPTLFGQGFARNDAPSQDRDTIFGD